MVEIPYNQTKPDQLNVGNFFNVVVLQLLFSKYLEPFDIFLKQYTYCIVLIF